MFEVWWENIQIWGLLSKENVNPVWGTPDAIEQAESLVTMCDDMFPWHKKGGFVRTRW